MVSINFSLPLSTLSVRHMVWQFRTKPRGGGAQGSLKEQSEPEVVILLQLWCPYQYHPHEY